MEGQMPNTPKRIKPTKNGPFSPEANIPLPKAVGRESWEQGVQTITCPDKLPYDDELTYKFRTLLGEAKLKELNTELDLINWDIVGFTEVRRLGENTIKLKNGHIFYHKGNEQTI